MIKTAAIHVETDGFSDITDITKEVQNHVRESGIANGAVTVFLPGATGAITTIEYEEGLISDFKSFIEKIVPQNHHYQHDQKWGDGNGFSHVRASLLGPSITIPFIDGKVTLGTWQSIIFIDFDNRPRQRNILCQIMGE